MNDLINRQAAIEVCLKYNGVGWVWSQILDEIKEIPSAVVRCKDCTHRCFDNRFGYMCSLDTGDPYEMGRDAHNENWYCADGERKDE